MNPTAEQIEQCAQVCWAAQRALRRTQSADVVPVAWEGTTYEQRQLAREQVCVFWHADNVTEGEAKPPRELEAILITGIVTAFRKAAWIDEVYRLLCLSQGAPACADEDNNLRECAVSLADSECNYFAEGMTPQDAHDEEMSAAS
jgi:hypothetical protein